MQKLRYYAAPKVPDKSATATKAAHTEFLRTGRISRHRDDWLSEEKRYLTYAEVAVRTGRRRKPPIAGSTGSTARSSFRK